jgi:hypothetical protein
MKCTASASKTLAYCSLWDLEAALPLGQLLEPWQMSGESHLPRNILHQMLLSCGKILLLAYTITSMLAKYKVEGALHPSFVSPSVRLCGARHLCLELLRPES